MGKKVVDVAFSLKGDVDEREDKLTKMYERPQTASSVSLHSRKGNFKNLTGGAELR